MGKIDCFEVEGIDTYFNSDDHGKHFHAEKTDCWNIRVYFWQCDEDHFVMDYKLKWEDIRRKDVKRIHEKVLDHQEELLKEWHRKVNDP